MIEDLFRLSLKGVAGRRGDPASELKFEFKLRLEASKTAARWISWLASDPGPGKGDSEMLALAARVAVEPSKSLLDRIATGLAKVSRLSSFRCPSEAGSEFSKAPSL